MESLSKEQKINTFLVETFDFEPNDRAFAWIICWAVGHLKIEKSFLAERFNVSENTVENLIFELEAPSSERQVEIATGLYRLVQGWR